MNHTNQEQARRWRKRYQGASSQATAANSRYPTKRAPRKVERKRVFSRKPARSASKEGTRTGPQETMQAGPEASPRTNASPSTKGPAIGGKLASSNSLVCDA